MTQGNNRISKRIPSEVTEARDLITYQCVSAMKNCKQRSLAKGYAVEHTVTHYSFHDESFFSVEVRLKR